MYENVNVQNKTEFNKSSLILFFFFIVAVGLGYTVQ